MRDMTMPHLENVVGLLDRNEHKAAWKFRKYLEYRKQLHSKEIDDD